MNPAYFRKLSGGARDLVIGAGARRASAMLRLSLWLKNRGWTLLQRCVLVWLERSYGVFVSPGAEVDPSLRLPHPNGVVIGGGVKIGKNVIIYQQVTLGASAVGARKSGEAYPTVEADVVVYAGAKIIGPIILGAGAVIAANAVVLKSVPANTTVAGVPAKIIDGKQSKNERTNSP